MVWTKALILRDCRLPPRSRWEQ